MNLINAFNEEQKRIYNWACESRGTDYLQQSWHEEMDSYFERYNNAKNIYSYGFNSLNDLVKQLEDLWEDEDCMKGILRVCAVSAYRNKPEKYTEQSDSGSMGRETVEIPEYVYVF